MNPMLESPQSLKDPPTAIIMNVPSFSPSSGSNLTTPKQKPTKEPALNFSPPSAAPTPSFSPSEGATLVLLTLKPAGKTALQPSQFPTEKPSWTVTKIPSFSLSPVPESTRKQTLEPSQQPIEEHTFGYDPPTLRTYSISPTYWHSEEPTTDYS
ncbi:hypothetical protein ACHAXS_000711 [Conticribra weissflogii]